MRDSALTGLFWRPDGHGGHPVSRGWPLNRLVMGQGGVRVEPSTFLGGPSFSLRWAEIERVERTSRGFRFRCADPGKTFVVGTLTGVRRLLQLVDSYCPPGVFDSAVHPVSWSRWDPAE